MLKRSVLRMILGVVLVMVLAMAAGCAKPAEVKGNNIVKNSNEVNIGDENNSQKIAIKQGQQLTVRLESNITTGFEWEIAEYDQAVIKQEGEDMYEEANPSKDLAGSGGWQTFKFNPGQAGVTKLKLIYHRPWEKDKEPTKVFEVQVTVD